MHFITHYIMARVNNNNPMNPTETKPPSEGEASDDGEIHDLE